MFIQLDEPNVTFPILGEIKLFSPLFLYSPRYTVFVAKGTIILNVFVQKLKKTFPPLRKCPSIFQVPRITNT